MDSVREARTGVRRFSSTISPDTIDPYAGATATGARLMDDAANDRLQLIARIWAETGIKPMAKRILELVQKHGSPTNMRFAGQMIQVDPREWDTQMDVTVHVGLGTGNRDARVGKLMALMPVYQALVASGSPLVTPVNLYAWLQEMLRSADLAVPEQYFTDPATIPPQQQQPQKPDPKAQEAQVKMQIAQLQHQQESQEQQQRAQLDIAIDKVKTQHEMVQEQTTAQFAMQLEQVKANHAMQLAELKAAHQAGLNEQKVQQAAPRKLAAVMLVHGPDGTVTHARHHYDDGQYDDVPIAHEQASA
jgi:hypothetical protein